MRRTSRTTARCALALVLLPLLALAAAPARGTPKVGNLLSSKLDAELTPPVGTQPLRSYPPAESLRYQRELTRNAHMVWGLDAPVATFAAQIHQESAWRADARSAVGAQGLAQFMPSTSAWISGVYPLGDPHPDNPAWAIRAMVTYNRHLWDRVTLSPTLSRVAGEGVDDCSRMAMTLSAYNGGLGWIYRDQKLAAARALNPAIWFGQLEKVNAGRAPAFWRENRDYPRQILLKRQAIYARWGGVIQCA